MEATTKRLYRAATRHPPRDREYQPPAARGQKLPEDASDETRRSWDALSAWDTLEAAIVASRNMRSARCIVCYDLPEQCGVTYEPSGDPGHFDIRGDYEELKRYVSADKVDLKRRR